MKEYLDILIVEDNPDWQARLTKYLEEDNHKIDVAANLAEAMTVLDAVRCHIVILDMRLDEPSPEDSGTEILEYLSQYHKASKVIVLTGYGSIQKATRLREQFGIAAYLDKGTFEPSEFRRLVRWLLSRRFRCFKIGGECTRTIQPNSRQVFVAMPFKSDYIVMDDIYELGIKAALEELKYKPLRADKEPVFGRDLMCNICKFIQESAFGLVDITDWNANVLLELGMMFGWGRTAVIIKHEQSDVPSDLRGALYIEYASINVLKAKLKDGIPNLEL